MNGAQYLYLLQEREFVNSGKTIYKLGMTKQENLTRFKQYPKGSLLIMQMICNDCTILERDVIKLFTERFILRKDIGNEYFEGDCKSMMDVIYSTIKNEKSEFKETPATKQIGADKELNNIITPPETTVDDNFIVKFIEDKIDIVVGGKIAKQELNGEFMIWHMNMCGKGAPNPKELHAHMDKKFGKQVNKKAWLGVRIKYDSALDSYMDEKLNDCNNNDTC